MTSKWSKFLSKPINAYNFSRILLRKKRQEHSEEAYSTNQPTMAANTCPEFELDSSSNENLHATKCVRNEPIIRSESDYSQPSSLHSTIPETHDVGTQPCVETDNVYITCEIYSMTDLPACMQPEMQTDPKPGMIVPEYLDGQCVILRAYRCKGVNTTETDGIPYLCEPLNDPPFLPPDASNELDKSGRQPPHNFEGRTIGQFCVSVPLRLQPDLEKILDTTNGPICHKDCPNLLITESTQTKEFMADLEEGTTTKASGWQDNLTTIQEQDEDFTVHEEDASTDPIPQSERKTATQTAGSKRETMGRGRRHTAIYVPTSFPDPTDTDKRFRKSVSSIFEMGTLLDTHSCAWLDRPRRRKECRVICTRPSDTICTDSRVRDSLSCCTSFGQPMNSRSAMHCDTVLSNGIIGCPIATQPVTCVQYEHSDDRCVDHGGSRVCRVETGCWTDPNEFWPANCWMSQNKRCLGPFQTFDRCTQSRSIHDNVYNRYCSNFNQAYNTIAGHCFCSNGYNAGHRYRTAMTSWSGYYAPPRYCCTFSSWY